MESVSLKDYPRAWVIDKARTFLGNEKNICLGYVAAMAEILDDEARIGRSFHAIVATSSSAGTQAGLVVGKAIAKWPGQILGISVSKDNASLQH
jgi:1-aminocyclopropane-1-carboxylate deaminase/D-cysteine desulfhydrase-like pyridoxal-dependent ACC family enzyme